MQDIDNAFRVLGLPSDAGIEQAEEAHRDLLAVWDPERFENDSRLRKKAIRKRQEIDFALEQVQAYHSRGADSAAKREPKSGPSDPSAAKQKSRADLAKPSLYDDIFSEKEGPKRKHFPIWIIVVMSVLVLALILILTIPTDESDSALISIPDPAGKKPGPPPAEEVDSIVGSEGGELAEHTTDEQAATTGALPAATPKAEPEAPPPAPKDVVAATEPIAVARPEPPPPRQPGAAGDRPRLNRQPRRVTPSEDVEAAKSEVPEEESAPEPAPPSQAAREAFEVLKEKSDTAGRLVASLLEGLSFIDWKILQEKEMEFYIDLVAKRDPDGREVHHVWVVNTEQGTAKPLSQAARDLEDKDR